MIDLEDENTPPNPSIKKLMELMHELFALSMSGAPPSECLRYADALNHVKGAIINLMSAKNEIARRESGSKAPASPE